MVVVGLDADLAAAQIDRLRRTRAPRPTPCAGGRPPTAARGGGRCDRGGARVTAPTAASPVVPQRLLLVLPSTGEFDSRTYRIATAALARGHRVTVLARWKAGLPERERDVAGYDIIRVAPDPGEALPGRATARRLYRRGRSTAPKTAPTKAPPPSPSGATGLDEAAPGAEASPTTASAPLPRRLVSQLIRRWSILSTVRSHATRATAVAPAADLIHGMAYMGIPVALAIADAQTPGRRSFTTHGTSTWTPGTWPGPAGWSARPWDGRSDAGRVAPTA